MTIRILFAAALTLAAVSQPATAGEAKTKFWNLTANTVTHFYLAPAGTEKWGKDQTPNDSDGTVDHDERLKITDVKSGKYDAKLVDAKGRTCIIKGIDVVEGDIFTIEESQLKSCKKG